MNTFHPSKQRYLNVASWQQTQYMYDKTIIVFQVQDRRNIFLLLNSTQESNNLLVDI